MIASREGSMTTLFGMTNLFTTEDTEDTGKKFILTSVSFVSSVVCSLIALVLCAAPARAQTQRKSVV